MPLSPPSSLLSPLVHTRRKQVTFSPLLPHLEQQHVNPDFDTPQQQYRHQPATLERAQLPAATFHRFRRLDELLEPSPAVRFPRSKALQKDSSPLRAGLTDSTSLATPPLSRKTPPSLADKRQSPTSHQGQEKKDGATQTSPSLARHPGSALRNAIIPDSRTLDREPRQGFVAQPRRSTESISPSQSSASARSRLSYLASPAATHTEDSNSRPPPPKAPFHGGSKDQRSRSPPLSPPFQAQAKPSIPPQPLYAAPPPRSLAHTSPTTYSSPLSTIGLAPFRLALSSSAAQKAKTASKERSANRQAWVQLLPTALRLQDRPSLARRGGGEVGGDVLLDSRDRDGRVWVIRGDGSSVTLFHPPPSAPPSPLILLHPIATFNQRQLLTLKKAEARTDGAGEDLLSSARKAYKAIEKVLHIVRTRTALMSFFPSFPHATLPSNSPSSAFPSADSSFYSSDSRMKAKCTLFSDLPPSAVSFSVTFSLLLTPASPGGGSGASAHTPSSQQESVAVGIFISPMRDMVIVSLTFPHRASSISTSPSETPRPLRSSYTDPPVPLSNMSRSRTERFSARGLSRLSSSLSSSASTGGRNLTAFLESHLSPTSTLVVHSAVGYALSAEYRAAVEKVRKGYLDATAPLPPPPRPPRPPAPSSPLQPKTDTPMLSGQAATVEAEEGGWESPETLLVKLLCSTLSLPVPPPPTPSSSSLRASSDPRPPTAATGGPSLTRSRHEEEEEEGSMRTRRRCSPGLGWITHRRPSSRHQHRRVSVVEDENAKKKAILKSSGEEGEEGERYEYEVLFCDGEAMSLSVTIPLRKGSGENSTRSVGGEKGVGGVEVEVRDSTGRSFPLTIAQPTSTPLFLHLAPGLAATKPQSLAPQNPHPTDLPKKLRRRMPLVVELLSLFLLPPSSPSSQAHW